MVCRSRFDAQHGLSAEARAAYARDGVLVLEDFVPQAQCLALQQRARELVAEHAPQAPGTVFSTTDQRHAQDAYFAASARGIGAFFEAGALDAQGRLCVPLERAINKLGHAMHDLDPVFHAFSHGPRLQAVAECLGLGRPLSHRRPAVWHHPGCPGAPGPAAAAPSPALAAQPAGQGSHAGGYRPHGSAVRSSNRRAIRPDPRGRLRCPPARPAAEPPTYQPRCPPGALHPHRTRLPPLRLAGWQTPGSSPRGRGWRSDRSGGVGAARRAVRQLRGRHPRALGDWPHAAGRRQHGGGLHLRAFRIGRRAGHHGVGGLAGVQSGGLSGPLEPLQATLSWL